MEMKTKGVFRFEWNVKKAVFLLSCLLSKRFLKPSFVQCGHRLRQCTALKGYKIAKCSKFVAGVAIYKSTIRLLSQSDKT